MNLVCRRIVFDNLKLLGRHSHDLDNLTLIEFLQTHPLPVSEFDSIPVRRRISRELTERNGLFF
jgi:hypothetical protein